MSGEELRALMSGVPSSVAVITVDANGQRLGLTVGSLVALSLEPPLVAIAVSRQSAMHELLREAGRLRRLDHRRRPITKNLGFALVAALSGAWKLPRHTFARVRSTNATPTLTRRPHHFHSSRVARPAPRPLWRITNPALKMPPTGIEPVHAV